VTGWKSIEGELALEVARIAAAPGSVGKRAHALLEALHRRVPFEAHWLGLLDLDAHQYVSVASGGIDERSLRYLEGPEFVSDVELVGRQPTRPVVCNRKFPVPWQEVRVWADYHWPAGFREGLGLRLFSPDSRYLGALGLLTDTTAHPTDQALTMIGWLAPTIAAALDPLRALGTLARIVADADAGVVLTRGGSTLDLPGLPWHPVLAPASPVLAVAAERLAEGTEYTRFLAPQPGPEGGWLRITALAAPTDVPIQLAGIVVASSAGRLHPPRAGGARTARRGLDQCPHRRRTRRGTAHRGGAPGAHPRQAPRPHPRTGRGPRPPRRRLHPAPTSARPMSGHPNHRVRIPTRRSSQHGEGWVLAEVQPSGPLHHSHLAHYVLGHGSQVTQLPLQRARFLDGGGADCVHKQLDSVTTG
jgi:hypothetical protein